MRFLALLAGEMRVNVGTASFGERPPKGTDIQVKPRNPMDGGRRHRRAAYFGFVPVVFLA
jgi:hypothetical protein